MKIKAPVSQEFLRALFANLGIEEDVRQGSLLKKLYWQGKAVIPHLPLGSLSQIWEYRLPNGDKFALAHQYASPEGKLLGKPDPKYLTYGHLKFYLGQDP